MVAPLIKSFSPIREVIKATAILIGANFSTMAVINTIKFNGIKAAINTVITNEITDVVPLGIHQAQFLF